MYAPCQQIGILRLYIYTTPTPVEGEALVLLLVVPKLLHAAVAGANVLGQGAGILARLTGALARLERWNSN